VAVADPGRSHSDRGNNSERGNSRGGSDRDDDYRRGNDNGRKRGEDDGDGNADPGSSRVDLADVSELAPSIAADSGELRSSEPGASVFGGFGEAGSSDRSGSYRADVPKARFSLPRLTLGNGNTPDIRRGAPESRLQAPVLQPAPAAPPPAPPPQAPAPPPSWVVKPLPAAPVLTQQLGVSQEVDWSDPLWGLTGLLLIPAAGAILGYRQARAAHAADRLRRS
jgi:hypothetical protein